MSRPARYAALALALVAGVGLALAVGRDEETSVADPPAASTPPETAATGTSGTTTMPGDESGGDTTTVASTATPSGTTVAPRTGTTTVSPRTETTTGSAASTSETTTATTAGPALPPPPYELAATRRCLRAAGIAVSAVRSTEPRLRALGDLAQRASLELRSNGQTVGLAFGDTRLLLSLMRVPNDPYRLETRRNALLIYLPSARSEAAIVRDCLRE